MAYDVTFIPGDGTGPEIAAATNNRRKACRRTRRAHAKSQRREDVKETED